MEAGQKQLAAMAAENQRQTSTAAEVAATRIAELERQMSAVRVSQWSHNLMTCNQLRLKAADMLDFAWPDCLYSSMLAAEEDD